ncbi:MAG: hypothetical protein WDM77_01970 [Steroidobacteraceae bacterium]
MHIATTWPPPTNSTLAPMNLVGRCCEQGWGTPPDPAAAADWYRRSAEGGYCRGQYNWASVLLTSKREDEAVVWLDRAAQGGTAAVRAAVLKLATAAARGSALGALAQRLGAQDQELQG